MKRTVRFYSLDGSKFRTIRTEEYADQKTAFAAVLAHATEAGYTNVRELSDDDGWSIRYTATTPNGRHGRNVASADLGEDYSE